MRSIIESAHASRAKLRRGARAARNSRARRVAPGRAQDRLHQPQHLAALRGLRAYLGDGVRPHLDRIRKQSGRCAPGRFVSTPNRARDLLQAARHAPLRKQRRPAGERPNGWLHSVEIVQCDRPGWKTSLAHSISFNGLHGRLILGSRMPIDRLPDVEARLPRMEMILRKGDAIVDRGLGDDRAGQPARRARPPCAPALDAAGGAAARGGRDHQYGHSHGRAPGRPRAKPGAPRFEGLPLSGMRLAFT